MKTTSALSGFLTAKTADTSEGGLKGAFNSLGQGHSTSFYDTTPFIHEKRVKTERGESINVSLLIIIRRRRRILPCGTWVQLFLMDNLDLLVLNIFCVINSAK